jgi:streptomycin 6-kinase
LASIVAEDDEAATRILCQSIRSLQASTHPTHLFKHLSSFEKNLLILQGHVPERILSKSIALFHDLNSDRSHDVVLHGDLHHYNILASGNAWKVIDPHAYVGDPTSEVGPMIFNPLHHFPTNHNLTKLIKTRIHMLIDELPYDPQRIKAWTFCRCILASAWTFESRGVIPEMIIAIAAILEQL